MWQGTSWTLPRDVDGVLWELTAQDRVDPRLAAMLEGVPAASYSLSSSSVALNDLSRTLGFRQHLATPVRLADVERALGIPSGDRSRGSAGRVSTFDSSASRDAPKPCRS